MLEKRKNTEKIGNGSKTAADICKAIRNILLFLMALAGVLSVLPVLLGYRAYTIVSGSMEPSIPLGSVVYVKPSQPEDIQPGDVIVFYGGRDGDAVTTHRVVENRAADREFITRGDANADNDMLPRPYESLIGRVGFSVPLLGRILTVLSSNAGRAGLLGIVFGILGLSFLEAGLRREKGQE